MDLGLLAVFVPVVVGLSQVVKDTKFVDKRWMPFVAVLIGVGVAFVPVTSLLAKGLVLGLTATGLFSTGKEFLTD